MLKIYDTGSKKIEEFKPVQEDHVGMYVCGPTVYGPVHLGHARTWIFFDWLRRFFLANDFSVKMVQNITDVGHLVGDEEEGEDKIEKEAKLQQKTPEEIAERYEKEYFEDLESLNILKPDISPRASEHIKEIIDFVKVLIEKKFAYEVNGNVYFSVESFKDYGKLSGRKIEDLKENQRITNEPDKKSPVDFALWKKADQSHLQKWPSPWGEGYPGWHIECSVMSAKFLGQPFDIHGSTNEQIFPHHENEIAQSEAYAGKPLADYWVHAGMLLINGQKMAKSTKNYVTVREVLGEVDADMVKIAFMGSHWRKPYNWDKNAIDEAKKIREKLVRSSEKAQPLKTGYQREINEALEDDFNMPKALAVILGNLNSLSKSDFDYIKKLFGLKLEDKVELSSSQKKMLQDREKAREIGDYKEADRIRDELTKEGIVLEDTPSGSRIIKK